MRNDEGERAPYWSAREFRLGSEGRREKLLMLRTAVSSYSSLFLTLLTSRKDWTFRSSFLLLGRCPHPQRLAVYWTASLLSLASLVGAGEDRPHRGTCSCVIVSSVILERRGGPQREEVNRPASPKRGWAERSRERSLAC